MSVMPSSPLPLTPGEQAPVTPPVVFPATRSSTSVEATIEPLRQLLTTMAESTSSLQTRLTQLETHIETMKLRIDNLEITIGAAGVYDLAAFRTLGDRAHRAHATVEGTVTD